MRVICTRKLLIICTPTNFVSYAHEICVLYARQSSFLGINTTSFYLAYFYTHFHETRLWVCFVSVVNIMVYLEVRVRFCSSCVWRCTEALFLTNQLVPRSCLWPGSALCSADGPVSCQTSGSSLAGRRASISSQRTELRSVWSQTQYN